MTDETMNRRDVLGAGGRGGGRLRDAQAKPPRRRPPAA